MSTFDKKIKIIVFASILLIFASSILIKQLILSFRKLQFYARYLEISFLNNPHPINFSPKYPASSKPVMGPLLVSPCQPV